MRFNLWRQLRLIGAVILCLTYFYKDVRLLVIGGMLMAIGVANGVHSLEERVSVLEEKNNEKTEA